MKAERLERLLLGRSPEFQALLKQSRRSIDAGKGLARDDFWQRVDQRQTLKEAGTQGLDCGGFCRRESE